MTEAGATVEETVREILSTLERSGTKANREGMARYGIAARMVFGVSVATLQKLARPLGKSHALAAALWKTGWYEARLLAAFLDEPARVTPAQMDRWARDFENWADCDTVCFHLFDKTPHAFAKVETWAARDEELVKRAAFALLASLGAHDRSAPDEAFARCLPLIEEAASDERNLVKKGVSWALRVIGRRSPELHAAAVSLAKRLAASAAFGGGAPPPAPPGARGVGSAGLAAAAAPSRWVGRDALRDLTRPAVLQALATRARKAGPRRR